MAKINIFRNIYRNKKVLITGQTGFKGSWLTLWLILLGAKVCGFSDKQKTNPSLFNILKLNKKIKNFKGDISKLDQISRAVKIFQPEIIFHLAAQSLVKKSYLNPIETFMTNSIGTLNLLKASKLSKNLKALVMITSDKVYKNIEIKRGYKENDIIMGIDPYSASKSCAEIIINMYLKSFVSKKKLNICVVRAGNVIGGGDWSENRIIPDVIRQWSKSQTLKIRNPKSTRPWQFVLEPLGAYLFIGSILLKKKNNINFQNFNVGPRKNINKNVIDLIKLIKKDLKNLNYKIIRDKSDKEAKLLRLNCNKIYKSIGWKPIYNFEQTINNTILWYKNYYFKKNNMYDFSVKQITSYIKIAQKKKNSWLKNG